MSKLTEFENKVFEFIRSQGELQISNIPKRMLGAIPNLKNAGLVKTFRKPATKWASKKHTFVKAIKE